jgi:hypothetical protein
LLASTVNIPALPQPLDGIDHSALHSSASVSLPTAKATTVNLILGGLAVTLLQFIQN